MATLADLYPISDDDKAVTLSPMQVALLLFLLQLAPSLFADDADPDAVDALIDSTQGALS